VRLDCARDELAGKLALAGRVASSKSTIPILSHVALSAREGVVEVAGTDVEISLRVPIEATIGESGAVVLPRLAADVIKAMPEGSVSLEHRAGEGVVQLTGGGSAFTLNCFQASDFPELPSEEGTGVVIPTDQLVATAERVLRAASRDETRAVLTGVLMQLGPEGIAMVATDSYRLAVKRTPMENGAGEAREAIVPARALAEVLRLAQTSKAPEVEIVLGERAIFRVGGARLTSRLIDGQFPDYRQLVPDRFEHEVAFPRAELLAVLNRIGVLAQRTTPIRLAFESGQVTVSAVSEQFGEGKETLPTAFSGDALEIGFNAEFLRDGVESVEGDEVRLGLISPLRPGLLHGSGEDYRYLLMPIRLNA
jgi:DNA polymerase-3 subunit beta